MKFINLNIDYNQNKLNSILIKIRKIYRIFLLSLLILINIVSINANSFNNFDVELDENTLQIVFFERIVRLLEIPDEKNNNEFRILVVNDVDFANKIIEIYKSQKIKNKKVVVTNITNINVKEIEKEINSANIVYFSKDFIKNYSDKVDINKLLQYSINHKTLSFSFKSNLLDKGLMINYVLKNNKIKYEVNHSALLKADFKPSYILLNYAEKVIKDE